MIYLPDTNACITFLRQCNSELISRWRSTKTSEMVLCSVIVYELRYGAARSAEPAREQAKLDAFLAPFSSLAFDDQCASICAEIRLDLERAGRVIGPHDHDSRRS